MATTLDQITRTALDLPHEQRAKLAHTLIVSIDEAVDDDAPSAWDDEIKRRVDEIRSGQVEGIPATEVFAKLRDKYR